VVIKQAAHPTHPCCRAVMGSLAFTATVLPVKPFRGGCSDAARFHKLCWAQKYTRYRSFQSRLVFVPPILQFEDVLLVSWHLSHDRLSRLGPPSVGVARGPLQRNQHILPICLKIRDARDPSHICHRSKTPVAVYQVLLTSLVPIRNGAPSVHRNARCDLISSER
jgi:hypothetical protein